jgi:hypothetical protein
MIRVGHGVRGFYRHVFDHYVGSSESVYHPV